ncbi:hypothetical protein ACFY93_32165 [Streptomyces sp. NPDC008313]|uniref:hypothetical protein n=1 Tax=Streptomyces sp. NPDC008313 TaxID=3364826 RepID=UPI0036F0E8D8
MTDPRQKPLSGGALERTAGPPPILYGFLLMLVLIFAVSYGVGSAAGPVSPGMSGTSTGGTPPGGGGQVQDTDMGGMG